MNEEFDEVFDNDSHEKVMKELETAAQNYFEYLGEGRQDEFISQYRKLLVISGMFEDGLCFMTEAIEHFIPAFSYDKIHNPVNGDLNERVYDLWAAFTDNSISDEDAVLIAKGEKNV